MKRVSLVLTALVALNLAPCCALADDGGSDLSANQQHKADTHRKGSQKEARELALEVVEAYGGIDAIKASNDLICASTGRIKEYSMMSGAANSADCKVWTKGDKARIEITVLGQKVITAFNGKMSWVQQGDDVRPADATTSKRVQEEIQRGLNLIEHFVDKSLHITLGDEKEVKGKKCACLVAWGKDKQPTYFYVDPETHLVLRTEYSGTDLEQGVKADKGFEYSDYRPFQGTMVPYRTDEFNGTRKSSESTVSTIEIAKDVDDSIFEMPKESEIARLQQGDVVVPFDFRENEIFVKARINDTADVDMIFDTGATQTIIDAKAAASYGTILESDLRMTTGSGSIPASYMKLSSLALGDIVLKDMTVAIGPLSGFDQIKSKKPVGLIGANILRRFRVTIDYRNHTITFADPHSPYMVQRGAMVIPTQPALGSSGLLVRGELDGKPLSFLVDSGAAFSNVSQDLVKGITPKNLLSVGKVLGLEGVKVDIGSVMFKEMKLGNNRFPRVIFSVASRPVTSAQSGILANTALAILGNPFWSSYVVTVDYRNQRLILSRSPEDAAISSVEDQFNTLQLQVLKSGDRVAAMHKMEGLARTQEAQHPGAAALAICHSVELSDAPLSEKGESDLKKAQQLATKSGDADVQAEVYAARGNAQLRNPKLSENAAITAAAVFISKGAELAPTNIAVSLALYRILKHTGNSRLADQIIDQVLLMEPSNWEALWIRYQAAQEANAKDDLASVTQQLKFYYPTVPKVEQLPAP